MTHLPFSNKNPLLIILFPLVDKVGKLSLIQIVSCCQKAYEIKNHTTNDC